MTDLFLDLYYIDFITYDYGIFFITPIDVNYQNILLFIISIFWYILILFLDLFNLLYLFLDSYNSDLIPYNFLVSFKVEDEIPIIHEFRNLSISKGIATSTNSLIFKRSLLMANSPSDIILPGNLTMFEVLKLAKMDKLPYLYGEVCAQSYLKEITLILNDFGVNLSSLSAFQLLHGGPVVKVTNEDEIFYFLDHFSFIKSKEMLLKSYDTIGDEVHKGFIKHPLIIGVFPDSQSISCWGLTRSSNTLYGRPFMPWSLAAKAVAFANDIDPIFDKGQRLNDPIILNPREGIFPPFIGDGSVLDVFELSDRVVNEAVKVTEDTQGLICFKPDKNDLTITKLMDDKRLRSLCGSSH